MDILAPAKVNLYLEVIRKMSDGYHEIATVFEKVSICDRISVDIAQEQTTIICDDPDVPVDAESLLGKIIDSFVQKTGKKLFFSVKLKKIIPIGAGLGGGSSDAAALLLGLNEITGSLLTPRDLFEIARPLGADIPFFLSGHSFAYGKGRGDEIQKVETSLKLWHIIVNPPFEVSTKSVYGKVPALGLTNDIGVDRMLDTFLEGESTAVLVKNLRNDLQPIVLRDFPVLGRVFSELESSGAQGVLLSGSGPTIFGIFEEETVKNAMESLKKIFPEKENWQIYAAQTC